MSSGERMSRMIEQLLDFTRLRVGGGFAIEPKERRPGAAGSTRWSTSWRAAIPTAPSTSARRATARQLGRRSAGPGALEPGRERVPARPSRPPASASFIDGTRARPSSACRCTTWARSRPPLITQIFDPLTGGQRRRDRSRGLGLGLFITQRIAEAHGGDVGGLVQRDGRHDVHGFAPALTDGAVTAAGARARRRRRRRTRTINLAALAQDQLRESEARFRLLVEAVKDYAIFMLDPSGRVVTWNAGAERIKGYEAREIIGQHFSEFYEEEEIRAGKCERELEEAARDGRFEDEGWRVRKDGTRFWANVVITALRNENGELVGFAKVTRDLTERPAPGRGAAAPGQGRGGDPPARRVPVAGLARAEDAAHGAAAAARHAARSHGRLRSAASPTKLQRAAQSSERLAQPDRIAARRLAHRDRALRAGYQGVRSGRQRQPRRRRAAPVRRQARCELSRRLAGGRSSARGTGFASSRR